jgi:phage shock protein C
MKAREDKKVLSGVLGGFARYFGIDDFVLRLIFFIVAFFSGMWFTFIIVYVVAAFIMEDYNPENDDDSNFNQQCKKSL